MAETHEYEYERECVHECEHDECKHEPKCEPKCKCEQKHEHEHECKPKHEKCKGIIYINERYLYAVLKRVLMLPESYCIEHFTSSPFSKTLGLVVDSADIPVTEDGKPQQVRPIYGRRDEDNKPCLLRIELGSLDRA